MSAVISNRSRKGGSPNNHWSYYITCSMFTNPDNFKEEFNISVDLAFDSSLATPVIVSPRINLPLGLNSADLAKLIQYWKLQLLSPLESICHWGLILLI